MTELSEENLMSHRIRSLALAVVFSVAAQEGGLPPAVSAPPEGSATAPRGYSIPLIDLARDGNRQVVVDR